jgi:DNA-binding HxlR family transcriptional regulator
MTRVDETLELLGRRWSLRVVWELRRDALAFSALRERLGVSPSVLAQRLRELSDEGIVERDRVRRYQLTGHGRELARLLYEVNRWAQRRAPPATPAAAILEE